MGEYVAKALVGKLDLQLTGIVKEVESAVSQVTDLSAAVKTALKGADKDIKAKLEKAVAALDIDVTPNPAYKEKLAQTLADLIYKVAVSNDSRTGSNIFVPILREKLLEKVKGMELK